MKIDGAALLEIDRRTEALYRRWKAALRASPLAAGSLSRASILAEVADMADGLCRYIRERTPQ